MPCFHPLKGYRGPKRGSEGPIYFDPAKSFFPLTPEACALHVACGQCIGCRLAKRQEWAARNVHELATHAASCFVTLTIDDAHMPKDGVVPYRWFQLFLKRLRRHARYHGWLPKGGKVRFFECFEYGERTARPHFHAIIYGVDFRQDRRLYKRPKGIRLDESPTLTALWGHGHCTVGDVTLDSIQYVAGYTTKSNDLGCAGDPDPQGKYHGVVRKADRFAVDRETGEVVVTEDGELVLLPREHVRMSRRPGIGAGWYAKFGEECFLRDDVVLMTRKGYKTIPVPKYYTRLKEREDPEFVAELKEKRQAAMRTPDAIWNNSPERLKVRKACLISRGVRKRAEV